ncbi:MAG: hypothetical protein NTZ18_00040 [Candidatus Komeilibacteria bacterium]|nr:hypothetical protein [Candidatus Komeilibacteria bacterium]
MKKNPFPVIFMVALIALAASTWVVHVNVTILYVICAIIFVGLMTFARWPSVFNKLWTKIVKMIHLLMAILIALLVATSAIGQDGLVKALVTAQDDINSWQPKPFPVSYEIWDLHHNIVEFGKSIPDSIVLKTGQCLLLYYGEDIKPREWKTNLYFGFQDQADLGNIRFSWEFKTLASPWYVEGENREDISRVFRQGNFVRQAKQYVPVTVPIVGLCQTQPPNEWSGTLPLYIEPGQGFSGVIYLRWWKR